MTSRRKLVVGIVLLVAATLAVVGVVIGLQSYVKRFGRPSRPQVPSFRRGDQPEPGGQGIAERLSLLGGFDLVELADGPDRPIIRPEVA